MNSFLSASAVQASVEGESVRSHFLNGTNMTVSDPCVACLVPVPLYAILLVFTVSILPLVIAAETLWLVCVVFSSTLLFPGVLKVYTLHNTGCVPHSGPYGLAYTVLFFACFLLIPFTLTPYKDYTSALYHVMFYLLLHL